MHTKKHVLVLGMGQLIINAKALISHYTNLGKTLEKNLMPFSKI